jgi:hypothetical protein
MAIPSRKAQSVNLKCAMFLGSSVLAGCVPYTTTYPKIEVAGASYMHAGCQAEVGEESMVYYPFNGIYISIDLRASRFGLHIPSGTVVELNGKTVEVSGMMGAAPFRTTLNLKAVSHKSMGTGYEPAQFMASVDHYTTPDNFGPLEGATNGTYLLWYSYLMMSPDDPRKILFIPKGLSEGTIEIPPMTINGQRYESQKLTFKRESFVGMAAVNC